MATGEHDLEFVESELAHHPAFGSPTPILEAVRQVYLMTIDALAGGSAAAAELADRLGSLSGHQVDRVLADPVLRSVLSGALGERGADFSTLEGMLEKTVSQLSADPNVGPLESELDEPPLLNLGSEFSINIVWNESAKGPFAKRFNDLVSRGILTGSSGDQVRLIRPTEPMLSVLSDGAQLLQTVMPSLTRSVFHHVRYINLVDHAAETNCKGFSRPALFESASTDTIPCCIFFSTNPLISVWRVAEAMLHEAAHNKLFDLILTRSILRPGYSQKTSPLIVAFWNPDIATNPNTWSVDRAILAFHVYVHLTLLLLMTIKKSAEIERMFGRVHESVGEAAHIAYKRALYLGEQVKTTGVTEIGQDGHALVQWLMTLLHTLRPFALKRGK